MWGAIMSPERYDEVQARQKRLTTIAESCTYAGFKHLKKRTIPPIAATSGRKVQQENQGNFKFCILKTKSKQTFLGCITGKFSV